MWDFALYLLIALLMLSIGWRVYSARPKQAANRLFLLLALLMSLWLINNYWSIAVHDEVAFLFFVRQVMLWTDFLPPVLYLFSLTYPHGRLKPKPKEKYRLLIWTIFVALVNLSSLVYPHAIMTENGLRPQPGLGIVVVIINMAVLFSLACRNLLRQSHRAQGLEKVRLTYLSFAFGSAIMVAIFFNMILPVIFQNADFMNLGIAAMSLVLIGVTGYAMLKTTFAGIDFVLAQFVYYGTLSVWLSVPLFIHFKLPTQSDWPIWGDIILFGGWAACLIGLYNNFGKWLQRKIVNHGADWQIEHDRLFAQIGHELELEQILDGILGFFSILIKNQGNLLMGDFLENGTTLTTGDWLDDLPPKKILDECRRIWQNSQGQVLLADSLADTRQSLYRSLLRLMKKHNVAAIFPVNVYNELRGILLLSPKDNGNPYFTQDIEQINRTLTELGPLLAQASIHQSTKSYNQTLQRKINHATRRLQRMNEQLIIADKLKDEFVSVASHELRTPMTAIKGYLWLVQKNNTPDKIATNQKYIAIALNSTERLISLVNDMLTVSRIEGGRIELRRQILDARAIVQEMHRDLLPIAREKKLKFTIDAPTYPLWINADPKRVSEVLHNLVGNALKFTSRGSVTLHLRRDQQHVYIDVTDTGCGIDQDDFNKLFSKFARMEKSYVKIKETGTGLGLYISRQIMQLHQGDITFTSELDKGSTFTAFFPRAKSK